MSDSPSTPRRVFRALPTLVILALLALIAAFLARPKAFYFELAGETMGTTYSVKIVDTDGRWRIRQRAELGDLVRDCLEDVNQRMSTYRSDSELSRFNQQPADLPFQFSPETFHVMNRAMEISELTGGAFDITVGPIVNAYGFGPATRPVEPPSEAMLAELKQRVGYRLVELDSVNRTARKKRDDVYCDLSAIAKGYGVDQLARLLDGKDIARYMVEVGGEVRVRGLNAEGKPWRIGIEKPTAGGRAIHRVIGLTDRSVATSGNYHNYYTVNGSRICHEIDPRTGRAISNDLASVSVIADDCETADALATAFMVLGPADGYNLAEKEHLAALFLVCREPEVLEEKLTSAYASLVSGGYVTRPASRPEGGG